MSKIKITTFYKFQLNSPEKVSYIKNTLEQRAKELEIKGLVVLGKEGINSSFCGRTSAVEQFKKDLCSLENYEDLTFKDSFAKSSPFRIFKVHLRKEIVSLGDESVLPNDTSTSLSPKEWHKILQSDEDIYLMDTRNWYETDMGSFKNAMIPNIEEFNEFPKWVEGQKLNKEKKVLMFCTGGIRCEKAQVALKNQGFKEVYQLEDGILKYIEEYPNQEFEGECFVFDHRVAVDQDLAPSQKYNLCPHCGQPAKQEIQCKKCDSTVKVCQKCLEKEESLNTCSKNCAHHYRLAPNKKGKRQIPSYEFNNRS